jgi:hypothetical protein
MEIKTLEVRDRATFIPVIAINVDPRSEESHYLWSRAGFNLHSGSKLILLGRINDLHLEFYPPVWSNRTMPTAHEYLQKHWDEVEDGQVLDVEYILGETDKPKESERHDRNYGVD